MIGPNTKTTSRMETVMKRSLAVAALCLLPMGMGTAFAEPAAYETPEAAVAALVGALNARDRDALLAAFGPEHEDLIFSGDAARDREDWTEFMLAYNALNRINTEDGVATLYIGADQWPLPFPIVIGPDGSWRFDAEAGREEILARRIGENEINVIELLRGYVRVQAAYRQIDYDGDGVMEFASAIISDDGERNGLYWPPEPGTPESPIGAFMAQASAAGYSVDGDDTEPEPYLGYYFKVLQRQGEGAPGGAMEYAQGGNMVAGHAILAFPSAYDETGVMSFLVGENGIVFEADLGEETRTRAAEIDSFDPVGDWTVLGE